MEAVTVINLSKIKEFGIAEGILYVEDICDSITADRQAVELTKMQQEELDRRVKAHKKTPEVELKEAPRRFL